MNHLLSEHRACLGLPGSPGCAFQRNDYMYMFSLDFDQLFLVFSAIIKGTFKLISITHSLPLKIYSFIMHTWVDVKLRISKQHPIKNSITGI